jgi:tetratricopeptide (TPR) repeat protein
MTIVNTCNRYKNLCSAHFVFVQTGIILLLGIASYANSLSVPLQFDDDTTVRIVNNLNSDLLSIHGFIRKARWFTDITFSLNRHLNGEKVLGYHLFNLAIHLSTAVVIYLFIQQAIEALKQSFRIPGDEKCSAFLQRFIPFTAAAVFVCHPVQTQAVTYIAQRYTSLTTFLYISSLLSYLLARLSCADENKKHSVRAWGLTSFLLAFLAMKSKEIAFTLPILAVAIEYLLFRGRLLKNRLLIALNTVLLLLIPLQMIYVFSTRNPENLLHNIQSAASETQSISRIDYLLTQFRVVATYLRLLVLPINQNLDYDYPLYHSLFTPYVLAALLLHIFLAGLALALYIRSQRHLTSANPAAGISMRIACLGIFWFYLALSVESSLIPIRDVIFEHRVYLPSAGFFMAVAAAFASFAWYRQRYSKVIQAAFILLCLVLTGTTIARNRIWSSELLMWQDVLKKSPNKARPQNFVGVLYFRRFMPEKALPLLVRALEIDSDTERYWTSLNSAIWIIDRYKGRCSEGMEYHTTIDKVDPGYKKPWMAVSYNNLGLAYEYLGNIYLAQTYFQKAVTFNPSLDLAWYNLALVSSRRNDSISAESSLGHLKAINPRLERDAVKTIREQQPVSTAHTVTNDIRSPR